MVSRNIYSESRPKKLVILTKQFSVSRKKCLSCAELSLISKFIVHNVEKRRNLSRQKIFPNGTLYEFGSLNFCFQTRFDEFFCEIDPQPCVNGIYTRLGRCKWILGVPFTHVSEIS